MFLIIYKLLGFGCQSYSALKEYKVVERMDAGINILNLFGHNRKAYENAIRLMDRSGKAAVIHPMGMGKSFVAFKFAMEQPDNRILWLALGEYIFHTQIENLQRTMCTPENLTKLQKNCQGP